MKKIDKEKAKESARALFLPQNDVPILNGVLEISLKKIDDEIFADRPFEGDIQLDSILRRAVISIFDYLLGGFEKNVEIQNSPYYATTFESEKSGSFKFKSEFSVFNVNHAEISNPQVLENSGLTRSELLESLFWYFDKFYRIRKDDIVVQYLRTRIKSTY
jgi:hypothetical protein